MTLGSGFQTFFALPQAVQQVDFFPLSSRVVTPPSGSSWTALCCPFSSSRTRFWRSFTPRMRRVSSSVTMASSCRTSRPAYLQPCTDSACSGNLFPSAKPEVLGKQIASYVAVLVLESFGLHTTWHGLCVHRPPVTKCPPVQFIAVGDPNQKYLAKSLCLAWLCWCWRHATCIPPGKVLGKVVVSCVAVLVLASCGMFSTWHRLCVLRPPVPRTHREYAPNDVVGKVPVRSCREFHRLQNTSSWTGSEAECRDAVCVSFSQRRCGESPRVKLQRVSSEDCRTPVRGQAV